MSSTEAIKGRVDPSKLEAIKAEKKIKSETGSS